jgi:hypothetical protein
MAAPYKYYKHTKYNHLQTRFLLVNKHGIAESAAQAGAAKAISKLIPGFQ